MTTPRLTPWRPSSGIPLITDTFDAWASNGWTLEDSGTDTSGAWGANGAFAISDLFGSTLISSELTKTYTTDDDAAPLPANTLVVVRVGLSWSLGVGCPGGPGGQTVEFFGATANTVRGALPGPIFFDPNIREILILTRTSALGEIDLRVGVVNAVGSYDIAAGFVNVSISTLASELRDIFYDAGTLYIDGAAFSITRGGHAFDPGEEWEEYDFPGKRAPVEGLDEIVRCTPVIRTRCMLTGEYQMSVYRPDGTWADHATITGARTFTPANLGTVIAASRYLQNVIVVWPRSRGDYIAVHFPVAINRKYGMQGLDKDEGQIDVEFAARIPAGEPVTTVPYTIHTYAAGTAAPG